MQPLSRWVFTVLVGFAASGGVQAEWSLEYRGLVLDTGLNAGSVVAVPLTYSPLTPRLGEHDLVVGYQRAGLRLQAATYAVDGVNATTEARLTEAYYDFSAAGLEWSLGKKVMAWGVGYGLRPLDVVQQEARLVDQPRELEGLPLLSVASYSGDSNHTAVLFERARQGVAERALAYQFYHAADGKDLYAVARLSEGGDHVLGLGLSTVVGGALEWHASAAYLSRYNKSLRAPTAPLLASADPFVEQDLRDGVQWLLGGTWSWANGLSLLTEAWYDDTAYTRREWSQLLDIAAQQRALLGTAPEAAVYGNLAWDSRAYQAQALMQHNLLLRLSHAGEKFESALALLWAPEDGGLIAILDAGYSVGEHARLFASVRMLGGASSSVYAQSPIDSVWTLGVGWREAG